MQRVGEDGSLLTMPLIEYFGSGSTKVDLRRAPAMPRPPLMVKYLIVFILLIMASTVYADPVMGQKLFNDKKCRLCHRIENPGTVFKPICPGLKAVKKRHSRQWLARWLKDPQAVWTENGADVQDINRRYFEYRGKRPGTRDSFMATVIGKQIVLTDEEISHLIDYLESL